MIEDTKLAELTKRILALESEKDTISEDIKEVYAEAKAEGADTKALKKAVALLAIEKAEREAQAETVEKYLAVIEAP